MNSARGGHTATLMPSGKLLVVGGEGPDGILSSAEQLDPDTRAWTWHGSLIQARRHHAATLMTSGKVLVTGGEGPNGLVAFAEEYDPVRGFWMISDILLNPRKHHTMTLLHSGQVIITGGEGSSGPLASTELYDPVTDLWYSKGSLSQARASFTATLLPSGQVLVVGGADSSGVLGSAELYDPATGAWSSTGSLAQPRKGHVAMLLPSGKVLVAGGLDSSGPLASAELYDPATGAWSSTGSLAQARSDTTATLLTSGKVLVTGGSGLYDATATAEVYDPATGAWSTQLSLSQVRRQHTATLLPSGKVLLVGGLGSTVPLSSTELYNPITGSWSITPWIALGHSPTSTLLASGKVLVTSGGTSSGHMYVPSAHEYDPVSGTWAAASPHSQTRYGATATLLLSGKVLLTGGMGHNGSLTSVELYDPTLRSWTLTGPLNQARRAHTATLLPSGKVLVVGGLGSGALASAEVYDPATGTWAATGSLTQARYSHTAVLLPSGKVLVAGGYANNYLTSAELYDPATGTWTATGALAQARYQHTATLLPSGKVLVAGGFSTNYYTASAEVYDPSTGAWTATGSLTRARAMHTATLLPSGKVLVANGAEGGSEGTSDLYDPYSGSWTDTVSTTRSRSHHAASLLPSGKVLITGDDDFTYGALYDDTGASPSWRPGGISVSATTPLTPGSVFTVNGTLLRGISEASGGNSRSSPTDFPVLTLRDLERGRQLVLPSQGFSSTHVTTSVPQVLPGLYLLSVTVNGLTSSTGLTIAAGPDTTPPTVGLNAPDSGSTLVGTVSISATALDNVSIHRVEFYDGNTLLGQDSTPPFSLSWDTRTTTNGTHLLTVKAFDTVGLSATSNGVSVTVDNDFTPPAVALTSPEQGAILTGTVTATATATDNLAIARVEFHEGATLLCSDTSAPYSCTWNTRTVSNGEHTLTAKAFDTSGNTGVATVTVTTNNDFTPPTAALTSPEEGATLTGTVTFTATASDASGISQVAFFVGGYLVGTATSAPYAVSYNTQLRPNGAQTVMVRAYDTLGNVGSSAQLNVTFDNDILRPTVELTSPAYGETLTGTVTFTATASDASGISRVAFFVNNTQVGTATSAPYAISYNTRSLANGFWTLSARAYDPAGNEGVSSYVSVSFDNDLTPPTVTLTSPASGAVLAGNATLSATASDNIAVTHVEFYDGATLLETVTSWPYNYTWNTKTAANGAHVLTAKAYDAAGQSTTSAGVNVTVSNDDVAPTVAFTAPSAGTTLAGTVILSATATDNVAVTRVEFFDGDTRLGTDTSSPYSYSWSTVSSSNGAHTLTAKAFDAKGNVGTAQVTVMLDNDFTPPTVALTAPAEGDILSGTVVLSAVASDNKAVTRVAFYVGSTLVYNDTTAPYSYSYNTRLQANGPKVLTARAYDAVNQVTTSAAVNVTFDNDFTPPSVTLTSPGEGETLTGTITFTAAASDVSGVSRVAFFIGTTQVGSDTSTPYSFSYNSRLQANGAKVLTAKAYDAFNNVATSAAVNVTCDNDLTPPTTSITTPSNGATVSGVAQIDAIASDDRGTITKVEFYRGSVLLGTVTSAPYTWSWSTAQVTVGSHTLKTRAWDAAGNSAYSPNITVTVTR
ncbi:Ig-like domain-containing protein [Hyalangium gracile]|uniref:Ig-like domain-containing protein n=1 Tax=Hyalangium gracile TaxID=394092 RepID=UPI001CCFDC4B|nr:Ig-like domain-containing protein [Hyalangium gracile]